jgi:hypothetical protein
MPASLDQTAISAPFRSCRTRLKIVSNRAYPPARRATLRLCAGPEKLRVWLQVAMRVIDLEKRDCSPQVHRFALNGG